MSEQKRDDGGSIFPFRISGLSIITQGMTLRDYFAAAAMQALCVKPYSPEGLAGAAYDVADAMLHARKS